MKFVRLVLCLFAVFAFSTATISIEKTDTNRVQHVCSACADGTCAH